MAHPIASGQQVQTPFGKGVVRALRNGGRVLVEIQSRTLEFLEADVTRLVPPSTSRNRRISRTHPTPPFESPRSPEIGTVPDVDLHGLTVSEALDRAERALDAALRTDAAALRLIHGRSGGRIKSALHQRLKAIGSIRGFHLDPHNAGVTVVEF